jgi:hypothetical protein
MTIAGRVKFVKLDLEFESDAPTRASVTLDWHDAEYAGAAESSDPDFRVARCAAQATLRALENVVGNPSVHFALQDLVDARVAGSEALLVGTSVERGGAIEYFVGISLMSEDEGPAAVRAVLNSTNRPMSTLLADK